MQYRNNKQGVPISMLGYGCMRFTQKNGKIDFDKAERELMGAFEAGLNFYDTAYLYTGSEALLGEIVERNGIRDKILIETKLPQYMVKTRAQLDRYFNEELKRLRTDYVDHYLMHHMTDIVEWENLIKLGILDWIKEKKESGQIRNIGFSFHGNTNSFIEILNAYDWDSCLVQYNYWDEKTQAGVDGVRAAHAKGIPVMIMEPLRGGKLVNLLPEKAKKAIAENEHGWNPAELAFRWLMQQPEVTCVLSGMNSLEMVNENCRIADEVKVGEFTEKDFELIEKVKGYIKETEKVGCTGCGYCMPCPKGVDIPGTFRCYNHMYTESKSDGRSEYFQTIALREPPAFASQCIECGKCELHCPQNIPIREKLKEADKHLRPLTFKIGVKGARWFLLKKRKDKKHGKDESGQE